MKVNKFRTLLLASLWLFAACNEKKDPCGNRDGDYRSGVFVVNEGPFGGTGTITWHDPATGETVQNVYESENCGATLGQFVQSLTFHNGKGYIVVNGANKVVIVDQFTFKYLGVIEGFQLPRFFMPIDDQSAYVSQWGADGISGSLARVDLNTKRIVKIIPVGSGPEKMVLAQNIVVVAHSGGYGVDSTLVEVGTADDNVLQWHLTTGKNPSSLVLENQQVTNPVYLCKGYYLDTQPTGNLNLMIGGTLLGLPTAPYSDDLVIDEAGLMFFSTNTSIVQVENFGAVYVSTPLFDQNAYGLGYDAESNVLYCADAKDFSAAGEVVMRKIDGTILGSFPVGIAPGEVVIVK